MISRGMLTAVILSDFLHSSQLRSARKRKERCAPYLIRSKSSPSPSVMLVFLRKT